MITSHPTSVECFSLIIAELFCHILDKTFALWQKFFNTVACGIQFPYNAISRFILFFLTYVQGK